MSFNNLRILALSMIIMCFAFVILFGIYCPPSICFSHDRIYKKFDELYGSLSFKPHSFLSKHIEEFLDDDIQKILDINLNKDDVLVFLHIQKTGGSLFERHLVRYGTLNFPCDCTSFKKESKTCDCPNINGHNWLFSRYSIGWKCGLHADWTELKACVNRKLNAKEGMVRFRKLYYFTVLREPVSRFISEWQHVHRGATWKSAKMMCNGHETSQEEWPFCFTGENWADVSLKDFLNCPYNLAFNRETRMLADLSLVHCYNLSALPSKIRDSRMLASAKKNLREMPYVALIEHLVYSQYLFHRTFGLAFKEIFVPWNLTHASSVTITDESMQQIRLKTSLDHELYDFAQQLFYKRLRYMICTDPNIPSYVRSEVKKHTKEPTWFKEAETWLAPRLINVLYKQGSRYPSEKDLNARLKHWKRKLDNELPLMQ